jgi:hypothetical protein
LPKREAYNPDSLKLLIKFIDFLKVKGEPEVWTLFLMQERLIYTAAYLMEKGFYNTIAVFFTLYIPLIFPL